MTRILNNLSGMFTDAVAGIDDRLLALLGAGGSGTGLGMTQNNAVGITEKNTTISNIRMILSASVKQQKTFLQLTCH